MMPTEHYFDSCGEGKIHYLRWLPEGQPKAVVQILHGIAEYALRYDDFARYLNSLGIAVVADDHMGHGKSMDTGTKGYFAGGWAAAVTDAKQLMDLTRAEFPGCPYVLFGHSMGSFMTRTFLAKYPDCGIRGAVICGTGWMSGAVLRIGKLAGGMVCALQGERKPSEFLQGIAFGSYNNRIQEKRTPFDWLNRDPEQVDAYIADPLCGFTASAGLLRDMLGGMIYNQKKTTLQAMEKTLPVLFIAGDADPVGPYGKGVEKTAEAFRSAGMEKVTVKLYPGARHEILNETNKQEVYEDVSGWLQSEEIL